MAPAVIDVRVAEDSRDVVHRAVQALAEGHLVVFPTETVYGLSASALDENAVARLMEVKGRASNHPLTLAIRSADDAFDFVPDISMLGRRLARRCWPGPVTLVMQDDHTDSAVRQLPTPVQAVVSPNGSVGLRVPAHRLVTDVLNLLPGPLVLTSANRSGLADATTAAEVVQQLGDDVQLVLDDGRCQFGQPSSVVQIEGDRYRLLREGVLSEANLRRLASHMVLLVCTGNTCRSPMAELLCRQRIAAHVGCPMDELEDRGYMVISAGIAAMAGGGASPEAAQVMAQRRLDLSRHEAQPLTQRLVKFADLILTMTQGHRSAILAQWPDAADRTFLLCKSGRDVADPVGGTTELYQRCAEQIDAALAEWIMAMDLTGPKGLDEA